MPALIEYGHGLGVLVIFSPKDLPSIQSACVIVRVEDALNCVFFVCVVLLHCCVHLIILVKPKANFHFCGQ